MATTHQKPLSTMPKPRHIGRDKTANPYPPAVLRTNKQPNAPEPEPLTTPLPLDTEKTKTEESVNKTKMIKKRVMIEKQVPKLCSVQGCVEMDNNYVERTWSEELVEVTEETQTVEEDDFCFDDIPLPPPRKPKCKTHGCLDDLHLLYKKQELQFTNRFNLSVPTDTALASAQACYMNRVLAREIFNRTDLGHEHHLNNVVGNAIERLEKETSSCRICLKEGFTVYDLNSELVCQDCSHCHWCGSRFRQGCFIMYNCRNFYCNNFDFEDLQNAWRCECENNIVKASIKYAKDINEFRAKCQMTNNTNTTNEMEQQLRLCDECEWVKQLEEKEIEYEKLKNNEEAKVNVQKGDNDKNKIDDDW
jgi:hypothetical protein